MSKNRSHRPDGRAATGPSGARLGGSETVEASATAEDGPDEADLVDRFWGRIRLFALRRLGAPSSAEDVAQETLRRVLAALRAGRVHTPEALPGFVFETARNVCRHRHRSASRRTRALDRFRQRAIAAQHAPDPLVRIVEERRREQVRGALERLGDDDRELLRLSYYEGVDTAELARRLEISPGAVRVRRHRALKRMGALLVDADAADQGNAHRTRPRGVAVAKGAGDG